MGVAQYGHRVAVRLPVNPVVPPQFWHFTSRSPVTCGPAACACNSRNAAIAGPNSRACTGTSGAVTGVRFPQLGHNKSCPTGSNTNCAPQEEHGYVRVNSV